MGASTTIEWTDASWTPIRARVWEMQDDGSGKERIGWHCEHVSEGCRNCYSERINIRLGTGRDFKPGELYREERKGYHNGEVKVFLDEAMLSAPLRWRKPRRVFVCSMTDLFADFVTDEMIDRVFAVMALCPQHTFQVLTKRLERMRTYVQSTSVKLGRQIELRAAIEAMTPWPADKFGRHVETTRAIVRVSGAGSDWSPLPNLWLGGSAERQQEADERIPLLLDTPAAIRFVSLEPLLGPMTIQPYLPTLRDRPRPGLPQNWPPPLDWVIVGGESGPNARPMHPDWARSLRDQCAAAGVSYFFKQWGAHGPERLIAGRGLVESRGSDGSPEVYWPDGTMGAGHADQKGGLGRRMVRVGKKSAGRLLDGRTHDAMPEARS